MKKLLVIFLLILQVSVMVAGTVTDSLLSVLEDAAGKEEISALNSLAKQYRFEFPERAIHYASSALEKSREIGDPYGEADALLYIAAAYNHGGVSDKSFAYLDTALKLCRELNYKEGESFGLRYYGIGIGYIGDLDGSIGYYKKAAKIAEEAGDNEAAAMSLANVGHVHFQRGLYQKALEYYLKAQELKEEAGDRRLIMWNLFYVGRAYKYLGEYEKSVDYFLRGYNVASKDGSEGNTENYLFIGEVLWSWDRIEDARQNFLKGLDLAEMENDSINTAKFMISLGHISNQSNDIDQALKYFQRSLQIYESMGNNYMISMVVTSIGNIYQKQGRYNKAMGYYKLAMVLANEMGRNVDISKIQLTTGSLFEAQGEFDEAIDLYRKSLSVVSDMLAYPDISKCYYHLGSAFTKKGKTDSALHYFNRSLELAKAGRARDFVVNIYSKMADVYYEKGDLKSAYEYRKHHDKLKDSLFKETSNRNISDLTVKYELENKEKEIAALSKEKELQEDMKNYLFVAILAVLIVALIFYRLFVLNKKINRQVNDKNAELAVTNKKLKESETNLINLNQTKDKYLDIINTDLDRAAGYITSLLPEPLQEGPVKTEWKLVPSSQIGGDSFGYHWIDEDRFAFYLLDVSGHGVGAALHSVSVLNVLRFQNLPNTDFGKPVEVLRSLNHAFQMKQHYNIFFTIWYGVYNRKTRALRFASAGHPPALLIFDNGDHKTLGVRNYAVGGTREFDYSARECTMPENAKIFIFSDGAYEIRKTDGEMWDMDGLKSYLIGKNGNGNEIEMLYEHVRKLKGSDILDDDFTIIKLEFA